MLYMLGSHHPRSRAISLLPLWAFMACSRVTFTFYQSAACCCIDWAIPAHNTYRDGYELAFVVLYTLCFFAGMKRLPFSEQPFPSLIVLETWRGPTCPPPPRTTRCCMYFHLLFPQTFLFLWFIPVTNSQSFLFPWPPQQSGQTVSLQLLYLQSSLVIKFLA